MYNWDLNERKLMDGIDIAMHIGKYHKVYRNETVCPFHDDHDPSLKISSKKQIAKCFSCGWSGNVIKFHMDQNSMTKQKAMEDLSTTYGIPIEPFSDAPTIDYSWAKHYNEASKFFNFYLKNFKPALDYMRARGISDETIEAFRIGICPKNSSLQAMLTDKFPGEDVTHSDLFYKSGDPKYGSRIVFPLFNHYGTDVIGWAGRYISAQLDAEHKVTSFTSAVSDESIAKYLNTMDDHANAGGYLKDYYLYGYQYAKQFTEIIVVEGYMDVLSMHSAGYANSVAIGGTAMTSNQFSKLANKDIVLALDADARGLQGALLLTKKFWYKNFKYGIYPKGSKDANDSIQNGHGKIDMTVVNLYHFIRYIFEVSGVVDIENVDERIKWYKAILITVESIDPSSDDGYILKESIKKYMLSYMGLHEPMLTDFVREAITLLGGSKQ